MDWQTGTAPDAPGVYYVRGNTPQRGMVVLYVGMSKNLNSRLWSHQNSPWYKWAVSYFGAPQWFWCVVHSDLVECEKALIKRLKPLLNADPVALQARRAAARRSNDRGVGRTRW